MKSNVVQMCTRAACSACVNYTGEVYDNFEGSAGSMIRTNVKLLLSLVLKGKDSKKQKKPSGHLDWCYGTVST